MVIKKWHAFRRETGFQLDVAEFLRLYHLRDEDEASARLPRGFDLEFANPQSEEERAVRNLVLANRQRKTAQLETKLFAQRKRLADAERKLAVKVTKAASESKRIAENKVKQAMGKLALLRDDEPHRNDYRIFPLSYAPVIVRRGGGLVMTPARYQCRPAGKPAHIDRELSLFNARRDNLTGNFWRPLFGASHAILPVTSFFENVEGPDGGNRVIEFSPQDRGVMWIACLYGEWTSPGDPKETLRSFAAVTDEPPAEVAAAGHDRVPVNLAWEAAVEWLSTTSRTDAEWQSLLDTGRQRPYYENREAA